MSSTPFFSVLIPTYQQDHYLADAINGVLKQSFTNFEVLVLDDQSTDLTSSIVNGFMSDSRLRYLPRATRLGRVRNYRQGVYDARGEWIVVCDGDDFYTDDAFLQTIYNLIQEHGAELVLLQGGHWFGANLETAIAQVPQQKDLISILDGVTYVQQFAEIRHFSHLTSVYKNELARQVGPYQLDILSSDMNTLLKMAVHGKVLLIRKAFGLWRQHHSNASSSSSFVKRFENLQWIEDCSQYFSQHSNLFPAAWVRPWRRKLLLAKYVDFCIEALQLWRRQQNSEALLLLLKKLYQESYSNQLNFLLLLAKRLLKKL